MRPRLVWGIFGACVLLAAAVMAWITQVVIDMERAEAQLVAQADSERLALWRMETYLVSLVSQESSRQPGDYQPINELALFPIENVDDDLPNPGVPNEPEVNQQTANDFSPNSPPSTDPFPDPASQVTGDPPSSELGQQLAENPPQQSTAAPPVLQSQVPPPQPTVQVRGVVTGRSGRQAYSPTANPREQPAAANSEAQTEVADAFASTTDANWNADDRGLLVRMHFLLCPTGPAKYACVNAPEATALRNTADPVVIGNLRNEIDNLQTQVSWNELAGRLSIESRDVGPAFDEVFPQTNTPRDWLSSKSSNRIETLVQAPLQQKAAQENFRNDNEYAQRAKSINRSQGDNYNINNGFTSANTLQMILPPAEIIQGPMESIWVGDQLLMVRHVYSSQQEQIQGCVLDWPRIRRQLLDEIEDLLPGSELIPFRDTGTAESSLRLAALPLQLKPGKAVPAVIAAATPLRLSLLIAWCGLIAAAAAIGVLLFCAVRLSERRATFVSAVTHELRTPLTTFRLYTDMLSAGMVPTEEKRQGYLQTLRVEAERLGHLVENVLSYARLERKRQPTVLQPVDVSDLLCRLEEPLQERAARSEMNLTLSCPPGLYARADANALERIVFNLVDNACKYGTEGTQKLIEVRCEQQGEFLQLCVHDDGAGMPHRRTRRWFRPFSKSAAEAAHSAPGIGLGLALCRRLARSLKGQLTIDHTTSTGARLVLRIPAYKRQA